MPNEWLLSTRWAARRQSLGVSRHKHAQPTISTTMLRPTTATLRPAADSAHPPSGYFLSNVGVDIPRPDTAIFRATLNGPAGSKVWVRAWLSNEIDGTLAEVASDCFDEGALATMTLSLDDTRIPENACIRIESAPLANKHVVIIRLTKE